jgi:outer membrane lipoprotein SlyB
MTETNKKNKGIISFFLDIASIGAGAYHGYCNAQGIPITKEHLESALVYGPALVRGTLTAIVGGVAGLVLGGVSGAKIDSKLTRTEQIDRYVFHVKRLNSLEKIGNVTKRAGIGGVAGIALGGISGAAIGGVQTLVGYGLGYFAGAIVK